jgi:hypothetical protein
MFLPERPPTIDTKKEAAAFMRWLACQVRAAIDAAPAPATPPTPVVVEDVSAKLQAVLRAEIQRRQTIRDEEENARWAMECDSDEDILYARHLARVIDRPANDHHRQWSADERDQKLANAAEWGKHLLGLAEHIEIFRCHDREQRSGFSDDVRDGAQGRLQVAGGPGDGRQPGARGKVHQKSGDAPRPSIHNHLIIYPSA